MPSQERADDGLYPITTVQGHTPVCCLSAIAERRHRAYRRGGTRTIRALPHWATVGRRTSTAWARRARGGAPDRAPMTEARGAGTAVQSWSGLAAGPCGRMERTGCCCAASMHATNSKAGKRLSHVETQRRFDAPQRRCERQRRGDARGGHCSVCSQPIGWMGCLRRLGKGRLSSTTTAWRQRAL